MNNSDDQKPCNSSVIVRVLLSSNQLECQKMIRRSSDEILSNITFVFLSKLLWYVVITTVFSAAAATLWSLWIFLLYIIMYFISLCFISLLLCIRISNGDVCLSAGKIQCYRQKLGMVSAVILGWLSETVNLLEW